jgi:hypothetical protein
VEQKTMGVVNFTVWVGEYNQHSFFSFSSIHSSSFSLYFFLDCEDFTINCRIFLVSGKTSLDPYVFVPDNVIRKDNIFVSLKNGTYDGKPYNLNADIWQLVTSKTVMHYHSHNHNEISQFFSIKCTDRYKDWT